MQKLDVLIVGGGLAGSAAAIHLARAGVRVALLDSKAFPRDKPCGEGLMPHGVRLLSELGILARLLPDERQLFNGVEYVINHRTKARADFHPLESEWKFGLGVRRLRLDRIAHELAASCSEVTLFEGTRVQKLIVEDQRVCGVTTDRGDLRASLIIGADGRSSLVRHQLGLDKPIKRFQRWGVRAHVTVDDPGSVPTYVEVYRDEMGEAYLTPVGSNEVCIALLVEKPDMKRFAGRLEAGIMDYIRQHPNLSAKYGNATLSSEVMACGPLACASVRPYAAGAMLVGDAAGFLDPINPEGMSLAMATAKVAAEVAVDALTAGDFSDSALRSYGYRWFLTTLPYYSMTYPLLYLSRHRALAEVLVGQLSAWPSVFRALMRLHSGQLRLREIQLFSVRRLLMGS